MTARKNCGNEVGTDEYFCSRCGASLKQPQSSDVKACPKCNSTMRAGLIVERESPLSLWIYGSGIYRTPDEGGVIGGRLAVKAYACPEYGYIEQYTRYLEKDRSIIQRAPTKFSQ